MTANDTESYLGCLNKSVNKYYNTYHHPLGKNPIHAAYSALTEEIELNHKAPEFKGWR